MTLLWLSYHPLDIISYVFYGKHLERFQLKLMLRPYFCCSSVATVKLWQQMSYSLNSHYLVILSNENMVSAGIEECFALVKHSIWWKIPQISNKIHLASKWASVGVENYGLKHDTQRVRVINYGHYLFRLIPHKWAISPKLVSWADRQVSSDATNCRADWSG
jgi:hypothetical protein